MGCGSSTTRDSMPVDVPNRRVPSPSAPKPSFSDLNAPGATASYRKPDSMPDETQDAICKATDLAGIIEINTNFPDEWGPFYTKSLFIMKNLRSNTSPQELAARQSIHEASPTAITFDQARCSRIWFEPRIDILYFADTDALKLFLSKFEEKLPSWDVSRIAVGLLRTADGVFECRSSHEDMLVPVTHAIQAFESLRKIYIVHHPQCPHSYAISSRLARAIQISTGKLSMTWHGQQDARFSVGDLEIAWATKDELMRDNL